MADSSKLRLRITAPDGSKKTLELSGTSFIVGTGEEAAIRVSDPKVGELHARLKVKDGQAFVTDLGSDSGTSIDGASVSKEAPFAAGESLQLGDTTIELVAEEKSSAGKFEKGAKGGPVAGKGGKAKGQGVQVSGGGASVSASAATDGNAARAIQGEIEESEEELAAHEKPTIVEKQPEPKKASRKAPVAAGPSVLDQPKAQKPVDPSMREYAARFLADELPESLKPTAQNKRLQVALVWGRDQFLDIKDVSPGRILTVGEHGAGLVVPTVAGVVPFVQPSGDGFRILLPSTGKMRVRTGGRVHSGEEVAKLPGASAIDVPVKGVAYTVGLDDRVNVEVGNLQLIARYTKPQPTKSRSLGERIDMNFLSTLIILLLCALAFERMIAITDFGDLNLSDDLFKNKDRFAKYIAKAEQKEKPKFEKLSGVKEGAKPKDDEGKFGKKDEKQKEAAPSKKGAPVVDVNKREEDRKKVMKSGLIALLGGDTAGATSNVFGPGGIGTGLNNALGGINGSAAMGDANGVGGLGARGGGAGGGGTGLGIGGLGGHGSGRGRGGSGEFDLGGTGKSGTKFVPGKTTVMGGLTADEVGRIIRRHWNEIKYCYEKELNKDPNLAGKVGIYFVIGPVGDVGTARVAETTLNNANAEECMLSNVRRWKFPAPRGGGEVEVNYPFIFQAN